MLLVHTSLLQQHPDWCSLGGVGVVSEMGRYGIPELQSWRGILSAPPWSMPVVAVCTGGYLVEMLIALGGALLCGAALQGGGLDLHIPCARSGPAALGQLEFGAEEGKSWYPVSCMLQCMHLPRESLSSAIKSLEKKGGERGQGNAENAECFSQSVNHKTSLMMFKRHN